MGAATHSRCGERARLPVLCIASGRHPEAKDFQHKVGLDVSRGPSGYAAPLLDHDVVTGSAVEDILARPADQNVVAVAAEEGVVAGTAD